MVCWHVVLPVVLNSQRLPTFDPALTAVTVRLLCSHSLDSLDTSVSRSSLLHAFRSELSAPPDNKSLFPVFRDLIAVALFREATITAPLPCCECMRWNDTYTHVFCAREKGCRIRVTHVHTRSDCVHTRDDTVRLNYAFRFVRIIYSSHIVSIKLDTVT